MAKPAKVKEVEVGDRFTRLTVEAYVGRIKGYKHWQCRCDCGNTRVVNGTSLKRLTYPATSCGCLSGEKGGIARTKHGALRNGLQTTEYRAWHSMRERCFRQTHPVYALYGGRGITVCEEWQSFSKFLEDMGLKPGPTYSLDRIDNNGPYSKENCRWATKSEQALNTRRVICIEYNGERQPLREVAKSLGISTKIAYSRHRSGKSIEEIFSTGRLRSGPKSRKVQV